MAEKKCRVEECTDPECEGNPLSEPVPGEANPGMHMRLMRRDAWTAGHRSAWQGAVRRIKVLKRALELAEAIWDNDMYYEGDEQRFYELLIEWHPMSFEDLARRELAKEESDEDVAKQSTDLSNLNAMHESNIAGLKAMIAKADAERAVLARALNAIYRDIPEILDSGDAHDREIMGRLRRIRKQARQELAKEEFDGKSMS